MTNYSLAEIGRLLAEQTGDMQRYLAMLNESSQRIQERGASLPPLLQRVLRTAKTLTGARYAALGVFDETGERLAQFLTDGVDDATKHAIGRLPDGRGILGAMTKEEGVLRLKDLRQHKESVGFPPHHPAMQSFLGISIRAHGKLFGRLYLTDKIYPKNHEPVTGVSTHDVGEFTDLDEQLIMALGFQAGTAIETASLIEEIRATQARYRTVLDSVEEGIFGIDLAGRCLFVNKACTDALGYDQDELVGENIHAMIHHTREDGMPLPETECPILDVLHSQQRCQLENEILWRKDGTSFPAICTVTSLRSELGTVTGAVVSFVDCTERRALEIQKRQGQRMEALGYLAAGVAHDFNNLLMVMKGYSELVLLETDLPAASRTKIEEVKKAADRATVLTSQLLAFGRKKPVERTVADINDLIRGIESLLRRLHREDIALRLDLVEERCFAKIDVGGLEQAMINLVVNARDAMPTGGLVEIRTAIRRQSAEHSHELRHRGPSVVIMVSDSGVGMDKATQARVFEPFFTTRVGSGGTGLGLATVYRVVTENDGVIQVASEPGTGTTFTVVLPLVELPEERPAMSVVQMQIQGGDETVLLVEDNADVHILVKTMLESKGYRVLTAYDGRQGEHLAKTYDGAIHLVIADAMMPRMSGWAMARRLRVGRPELRVLFITGGTDDEVARYGDLSTQGEILLKPFTSEVLLHAVRRMLDRPETEPVPPSTSRKSYRILLLDDNRQVSAVLQEVLKREGYAVLASLSGAEAIQLLQQAPVDLLITDMLMPDMDGVEVIRKVRGLWPSLKILALSGGGIGMMPEVYLSLAQQLGAIRTLAKPFAHEELLTVVRELID